jgi:hypothetical protein
MAPEWNWLIRPAEGSDLNFIYVTWVNALWLDVYCGRGLKKSAFRAKYLTIIDSILADPESKILVACDPNDPFVIYGYLVAKPPTAHFTFIKSQFRKLGIAKSLFLSLKCSGASTHWTSRLKPIAKKYPELTYHPHLLFQEGELSWQ